MITQMKCMQMIYYGKDEFKRFTHYVLMVQLKFELEHNIAEPRQWPQAVRQSHKSKIEGPIVATRTHIYAHDRLYRRVQGVARSPRVPGRHNSPPLEFYFEIGTARAPRISAVLSIFPFRDVYLHLTPLMIVLFLAATWSQLH